MRSKASRRPTAEWFTWSAESHKKFLWAVERCGGLAAASPSPVLAVIQTHPDGPIAGLEKSHIKSHLQRERKMNNCTHATSMSPGVSQGHQQEIKPVLLATAVSNDDEAYTTVQPKQQSNTSPKAIELGSFPAFEVTAAASPALKAVEKVCEAAAGDASADTKQAIAPPPPPPAAAAAEAASPMKREVINTEAMNILLAAIQGEEVPHDSLNDDKIPSSTNNAGNATTATPATTAPPIFLRSAPTTIVPKLPASVAAALDRAAQSQPQPQAGGIGSLPMGLSQAVAAATAAAAKQANPLLAGVSALGQQKYQSWQRNQNQSHFSATNTSISTPNANTTAPPSLPFSFPNTNIHPHPQAQPLKQFPSFQAPALPHSRPQTSVPSQAQAHTQAQLSASALQMLNPDHLVSMLASATKLDDLAAKLSTARQKVQFMALQAQQAAREAAALENEWRVANEQLDVMLQGFKQQLGHVGIQQHASTTININSNTSLHH